MKCENAMEALSARLDHVPDASQDAAVEKHLASCPNCREEARLLSDAWNMLGVLQPIQPSADFRARFWARVRREEAPAPWRLLWNQLILPVAGLAAVWFLGVTVGALALRNRALPLENTVMTLTSPHEAGSIEQIWSGQ